MDFYPVPKYDFNFKLTATDYHRELVSRHPRYRPEYLFMDDLQGYVKAFHRKDKDFSNDWGDFGQEAVEDYKLPAAYNFEKNPDEWLRACPKIT